MTANSASPDSRIRIETEGALARLVIDNPARRNALDLNMWRALTQAVRNLGADDSVRAVLVTGSAAPDGTRDFSAGADISEFETTRATPQAAAAYDAVNLEAFAALRDLPKPTLAVITGNCMGGGLGIALACDMRLAASDARFCLPPARLGLAYPPEGLADVVNAIGAPWARRLIYTAEVVPAERALAIGFVEELHAPEALDGAALALATLMSRNAPLSQQAGKAAIAAVLHPSEPARASHAARLAADCYASADFAEGRAAFLEKRKPVFSSS